MGVLRTVGMTEDKPRLLLRRPVDPDQDPEEVARAFMDGRLTVDVLADDAVYSAVMQRALGSARQKAATELAHLDAYYDNAVAQRFGKALGDDMSVLGIDPDLINQLDEAQLRMYAARVQENLASTMNSPIERQQYLDFGTLVQKALDNLAHSKEELAKSILTAKPDDGVDEAPPPEKNKGKQTNDKGKTAYSYDKKNGGKSPEKAPKSKKGVGTAGKPGAPGEGADQPQQVTEPQPIDPKPLADKLGVTVKDMKDLAGKKSREEFVGYFTQYPPIMKKFNLTVPFLSSLYDQLTQPPAPPPSKTKTPPGAPSPAPAAQPAPANAVAPAMGKAILHFVGSAGDEDSNKLMTLLKSQKVRNQSQMAVVVQRHFDVGPEIAVEWTRTLLRKWESEAVVTVTPR